MSASEQHREWDQLTNRLTTAYEGYDVTIEVVNPETGDSAMVERLPFDTVTYDHKDDVMAISVGGNSPRYPVVLRHLIQHPQELLVDELPDGAALKITDSTGTTTLVRLLHAAGGDDDQRS